MLSDFEQIDVTKKARFSCQLWSDIGKTDRLDRIYFDLTLLHAVPGTHPDMRSHPHSDAASDFSPTNSIAKSFGEHHQMSLHPAGVRSQSAQRGLTPDTINELLLGLIHARRGTRGLLNTTPLLFARATTTPWRSWLRKTYRAATAREPDAQLFMTPCLDLLMSRYRTLAGVRGEHVGPRWVDHRAESQSSHNQTYYYRDSRTQVGEGLVVHAGGRRAFSALYEQNGNIILIESRIY